MTFESILEEALIGKFVEVYLYKTTEGKGYCTLDKRNDTEMKYALIKGISITEEDHEGTYMDLSVDLCGVEYCVEVESNFTDLKLKL